MTIDPANLSATAVLTFDDEFNTLNLWNGTSGTWTTKYPFSGASGGSLNGNGEQEWYINSLYAPTSSVKPWTVSNGVLTLTAAPAAPAIQPLINNYQYTSGLINTYNSFSQTYGYFEMRADLPKGQGYWPAFWLLPADGTWPPEIDVMEVLGNDTTMLYTTVHTNSTGTHTSSGIGTRVSDMSVGFHTYGVDWEADYLTFYFDGQQVFKTATPSDLVNKPMYMIANLAVGGYWPGMVNSTTPFPGEMQIDYIRAYSAASGSPPPPPPPPVSRLFTLPVSATATHNIRGTSRNDTINGTGGADNIDGRNGADKMAGGAGDDTYNVDRATDTAIESGAAGIDTVLSKAPSFVLGANVENIKLTSGVTQSATGNGLDNNLTANDYASTLNGGAGNDILIAGRGANTLTGGAGTDIFHFDNVPTKAGHVTDFTPGTDVLDLRGLFTAANYSGSNPLTDLYLSFVSDSAGGTKVMFDGDGAGTKAPALVITLDHVSPAVLAMQSDWMFKDPGTQVTPPPPPPPTSLALFTLPTSGTGIDTVSTVAASFTLAPDIENATLVGSSSQNVTGNALGNILKSNDSGSTLNGGDGTDILIAGHSADMLAGGAGSDIFQFDVLPWSAGHITDFTKGTDMLDLRTLFTAAGYTGTDPIADGYLSFANDGAGSTKVLFDPDGFAAANPWPFVITTIDHVLPNGLGMQVDWYYH